MALAIKKVSDIYEMKVFTDQGDYFGDVEESIITTSKVFGWKIKATKNSALSTLIGGAKGVIVPHQLVKAIGGIMIISRAAIPSFDDREVRELEQQQQ
jgi:sporulation protein YlmC with PRC-barrel domain